MRLAEARALIRLARRTARRSLKRTVLIVLLVAFPVAAAQVTAGVIAAGKVSREEQVSHAMGSADALIHAGSPGGANEGVDEWVESFIRSTAPDADTMSFRSAGFLVRGPDGATLVSIMDLDPVHPLAPQRLGLVEGRLPTAVGEIAVSDGLSIVTGAGIGDDVTVGRRGVSESHTVTVVGVVRDVLFRSSLTSVVSKGGYDAIGESLADVPAVRREYTSTVTLVAGPGAVEVRETIDTAWSEERSALLPEAAVTPRPAGLEGVYEDYYLMLTAEEIGTLAERAGTVSDPWELDDMAAAMISARDGWLPLPEVFTQGPGDFGWVDSSLGSQPVTMGTAIAALLMVEVALVAGAAYATGARRRLRELGLMSVNGATAQHLKWSVVGESLVAGGLGALLGTALGVVLLTAGRPVMQLFVDRMITGFPIGPLEMLAPAIVGIVGVMVAAWIPARTASRVPAATALEGRMPLNEPARWVIPVGLALVGFGAFLLVVARSSFGTSAAMQALVAVVLMVGGFALLSGPMVAWVGRRADRFKATARLMVRDSARQRTRAATAVAATMVILAAPVVLGAAILTEQARNEVRGLPGDTSHVFITQEWGRGQLGGDAFEHGVAEVRRAIPDADRIDVTVYEEWGMLEAGPAGAGLSTHPTMPGAGDEGFVDLAALGVAAGTTELVEALGIPDDVADAPVIVLGVRDREVVVVFGEQAVAAVEIPANVVHWGFPRVLVSDVAAQQLDLTVRETNALLINPEPLTERQQIEVSQVGMSIWMEWSYGPSGRDVLLIASGAALIVVLLITALITALSATESDHDLRTMVAVGAPPKTRRVFLGLQSAYYTLFAALLATPLALLLMKVAAGDGFADRGAFGMLEPGYIVVPWLMIGLVVVVIPSIVGTTTALFVRSAPTMPPRRIG